MYAYIGIVESMNERQRDVDENMRVIFVFRSRFAKSLKLPAETFLPMAVVPAMSDRILFFQFAGVSGKLQRRLQHRSARIFRIIGLVERINLEYENFNTYSMAFAGDNFIPYPTIRIGERAKEAPLSA